MACRRSLRTKQARVDPDFITWDELDRERRSSRQQIALIFREHEVNAPVADTAEEASGRAAQAQQGGSSQPTVNFVAPRSSQEAPMPMVIDNSSPRAAASLSSSRLGEANETVHYQVYYKKEYIEEFPTLFSAGIEHFLNRSSPIYSAFPNGRKYIKGAKALFSLMKSEMVLPVSQREVCQDCLTTFGLDLWQIISASRHNKLTARFRCAQERFHRFSVKPDLIAKIALLLRPLVDTPAFQFTEAQMTMFAGLMLECIFTMSIILKLNHMVPEQSMQIDTPPIETLCPQRTVAYIAGYCLRTVKNGCYIHSSNSRWQAYWLLLDELCATEYETSGLPVEVQEFLISRDRGGLMIPNLGCLQFFMDLARLATTLPTNSMDLLQAVYSNRPIIVKFLQTVESSGAKKEYKLGLLCFLVTCFVPVYGKGKSRQITDKCALIPEVGAGTVSLRETLRREEEERFYDDYENEDDDTAMETNDS